MRFYSPLVLAGLGVILAVLAFAAGGLSYRQGWLKPVLDLGRGLFTGQGITLTQLPEPVQKAAENVKEEGMLYMENGLPTLYLDIPFKSLKKLEAARGQALKNGILFSSDADLVPARLSWRDGEKIKIQMRLKGDWTDHLNGKKWSFRIHLDEDEKYVDGMRQFSIQAPETREYLKEWAFHSLLIKEGVMTPRYSFANVLINGEWRGVYALEENFSKEMIEAEGRRVGVIIRYDEDPFWRNTAGMLQAGASGGQFTVFGESDTEVIPFSGGSIAKSAVLTAEAGTAIEKLRAFQLGQRSVPEVFDVKLWGRFYALSDLWAACHGVYWHNLRFYYNPVTGLLEPVAFDAEPLSCGGEVVPLQSVVGEFDDSRIFADPAVREAYASELLKFTSPDYQKEMQKFLTVDAQVYQKAMAAEYDPELLEIPWEVLAERAKNLAADLASPQLLRGAYWPAASGPDAGESGFLQIELTNLSILPVEVSGLEVEGKIYGALESWQTPSGTAATGTISARWESEQSVFVLPPGIDQPTRPSAGSVRFMVPFTGKLPDEKNAENFSVRILARIAGTEKTHASALSLLALRQALLAGPVPETPVVEEVLKTHPFLARVENEQVLVTRPGEWVVKGDLVLPEGYALQILGGTTLKFEPGAVILARGPLHLLGSENRPVLLTAAGEQRWGGVVVIRAAETSWWSYATVEKTGGIERLGWIQTGSNNFFESAVHLDHARILDADTEDGINVMHASFSFNNSEFAFIKADAFDSDYSGGEINNCVFHDIGADAIDISSAVVTVNATSAIRVGDKGISGGEHSEIHVDNFRVEDASIGMAAKDLSKIYAANVTILRPKHVGLAAYTKKSVFGPGWMEITQLTLEGYTQFSLVQTGSTILIDGRAEPSRDVDVKKLYQNGFLGN